jgi:hypothetical protein
VDAATAEPSTIDRARVTFMFYSQSVDIDHGKTRLLRRRYDCLRRSRPRRFGYAE